MKKLLLFIFLLIGLITITSCEITVGNSSKINHEVDLETWNKEINDYGFAKGEESKLLMKFYSSPLDVSELEPNMTLSKDKLVFELTHIIAAGNFTTYFDFSNEEFVGYQYYGIEHDKYVKKYEDITIDDIFDVFLPDFKRDFSLVKYENNQYSAVTNVYEEDAVAYYSFENGNLREFKILVDNDIYFLLTIEETNSTIILPNANYLNEMKYDEMGCFINELLKEFRSYNLIGEDYEITVNPHYVFAEFEYNRIKKEDDSYKTIDELLQEIKKFFIDNEFNQLEKVIEQSESIDELTWFGRFEEGNEDGIIIKLLPESEETKVLFAVVDYRVLEACVLKEYLEPRFLEEDDGFTFDRRNYIDNNDCLLVRYDANIKGNLEDLISLSKTYLKDNGYEWNASSSSTNYHYDVYVRNDLAVKINFINDGDNFILELTICVSYKDDVFDLIEYGINNPLFE